MLHIADSSFLRGRFSVPSDPRVPQMDKTLSGWAIRAGLEALFPFNFQREKAFNLRVFDLNVRSGQFQLSKLEDALAHEQERGQRFLAFTVIRGQGGGHAVGMMFDPEQNALSYQDPWGDAAPQFLRDSLESRSDGLRLNELQLQQQYDQSSCGYITMYNLLCWACDQPLSPEIDIYTLRKELNAVIDEKIETMRDVRLSPDLMRAELWLTPE